MLFSVFDLHERDGRALLRFLAIAQTWHRREGTGTGPST